MKISSKSILSPSHTREPTQISLSTSLSRRLKNSGSIKSTGQASPMFPTVGKKKGCAFENPEPSSPKVTCIGQVRVKSKKQNKKMKKSRSKRSRASSEASFRKRDQQNSNEQLLQNNFQLQNSQERKWVHLPLTICEALRGFGGEFNCFLPCKSSCMTNEQKGKEGKCEGLDSGKERSCGAVFARWLVNLHDGEGKGREMEFVVGGKEGGNSQRRERFEGIEFKEEKGEIFEEEGSRVSICIPPKNALLLMRCRSDPVKMAALANRLWDPPVQKVEDEAEEGENGDEKERELKIEHKMGVECQLCVQVSEKLVFDCEDEEKQEFVEENPERSPENDELEETEANPEKDDQEDEEQVHEIEKEDEKDQNFDVNDPPLEFLESGSSSEDILHLEKKLEIEENGERLEQEQEKKSETETGSESEALEAGGEEEEEKATHERSVSENPITEVGTGTSTVTGQSEERESQQEIKTETSVLPDCLLLMMCEPKLSMEVSKETWVCSTDFIRRKPEKEKKSEVDKTDGADEPKKSISIDMNIARSTQQLLQLTRNSCSYPGGQARVMARVAGEGTVIEQKLVSPKGCEPLVLTRCKSAPMRSAAKVAAAETCFWKNRKLEPQCPATLRAGF